MINLCRLLAICALFFLNVPSSFGKIQITEYETRSFIMKLQNTALTIQKSQDIQSIRNLISKKLLVRFRPGLCFIDNLINANQIHGWYPEQVGTQDPILLLTMIFHDLQSPEVVLFKDKSFDPYRKENCEIEKKWSRKWIAYPGDYLQNHDKTCPGSTLKESDEVTLLFFNNGENVFFGLKKQKGKWILSSVGIDSDCDT